MAIDIETMVVELHAEVAVLKSNTQSIIKTLDEFNTKLEQLYNKLDLHQKNVMKTQLTIMKKILYIVIPSLLGSGGITALIKLLE